MHTSMNGSAKCQFLAQRAIALHESLHNGNTTVDVSKVFALVEVGQDATNIHSTVTELSVLPVDNEEFMRFLGRLLGLLP